jgi:diguanylate cyclase
MDPLLSQLSTSVSSARTLEDLTRPMLEMLEAVTGLESTYLTRIDAEQGLQHILYARNVRQMQIPEGLAVPWGDTLCKRALDEGRVYTDNVAECWGDSDAARQLGIQTYVSTPVRTDSGGLYGTLCAASAESRPLPANAFNVLSLFARLIGQHVEREQLLQRLTEANAELATRAATDALTNLPNRRAFLDELRRMLAQAERDGRAVVVAFIDLDGFKSVNDLHGHDAGDAFLVAMAHRLQQSLRAGDLLARLGGDEFVVACPGPALEDPDLQTAAEVFGARVAAATAGDFPLHHVALHYDGASVGAVAVDPRSAGADEALRQADAAMYAVKRRRRASPA